MLTYVEFKQAIEKRNYGLYHDGYHRVISFVNAVYGEENIKAFYAKNLVNELASELFFVFEKGLLIISKQGDSDFVYNYNTSYVINKKLVSNKFPQNLHELTVTFYNGDQIIFNNKGDSNSNWAEEYTESIIELFKFL